MRNGYVTKHVAPKGYVAVTKPLAEALYVTGKEVTFCGNNVNPLHVFGGYSLGYTHFVEGCGPHPTFEQLLNSFFFYLEPELGRYVVFYAKAKDAAQ